METKKLKYFCKYLPVEGEIKIGGMTQGTAGGFYDVTEVEIMLNEKGLMKYKPFKLFLCSRDIKVGDKYLTAPDYSNERICEDDSYDFTNCLKVIGEISPEAIWVKEGDEFDEDEILQKSETIMMEERLWLYNEEDGYSTELTLEEALEMNLKEDSNIHSYKIGHRYKWKDAEDEAEVTYYYNQYKIQCPTCKTFH